MAPAGSGIPRGASGRGGSWSRRGSSSSILSTASPARVITSSTPSTGRWRPAFRQQRRQRYFHTDNLGPVAVIADENGAVVERDGYDAWGKRRLPTGADGAPAPSQTTTRGFTGQEELDFGLVHLNGRVYDPLVGRMMSADPMVPDPLNGQAWNRYAYVINNPLAFTDPSGYCFLGMRTWGRAISTFFDRTFGVLFRDVPILGTLFEIGATALCLGNPVCAIPVAFASTAFVAGVTSGNLGYALRAGLIAAATAVAFYEVGEVTGHNPEFGTSQYFENVAGHALVGCASAVASGGKCGPAALAGGITSAAGPFINGQNFAANVVSNAVLGGLASVAGGGKFANGAITGAFGYLFNGAAGRAIGGFIGGIIAGIGAVETGPGDLLAILAGHYAGGEIGSRLEDALWGNLGTLQDHFDRHGFDFGATDPIDYADKARDFFDNNVGSAPTKIDPAGNYSPPCGVVTRVCDVEPTAAR